MSKQIQVQNDGRINGLANRYQVGRRTISNWVAWRIIVGQMVAGEHVLNAADCDEALIRYTHEQNRKEVK